ncbi:MAG: tyrosine-type recombinase/integrase [Syntrophobacteraceae bacterium]
MRIQNTNKGDNVTVEPIRDLKAIEAIKKLISSKPRDLLLFTMGINNGLRTIDLLKLKVGDVRHLKAGDSIQIIESKTGKLNVMVINKSSYKALQGYLSAVKPADDDYLFASRKGASAITTASVNGLVKSWCKALNIAGSFGAHTLRKTFGYHQRTKYGVGFEVLAKRFNHSSVSITQRYLGITDREVALILNNEI